MSEQDGAWSVFLEKVALAFSRTYAWHLDCRVLQARAQGLPYPRARPCVDRGYVHLAWDNGAHCLALDVFVDGRVDWFFRNRTSETTDGTEAPVRSDALPDDFCRYATLWRA